MTAQVLLEMQPKYPGLPAFPRVVKSVKKLLVLQLILHIDSLDLRILQFLGCLF